MRTQESIYEDLRTGNFVTKPGDVYILEHTSACLSDSLDIKLVNRGEEIYFGLPNNIKAWNFLKQLNEIGGRRVLYQVDDNEPINLEDSQPYKYRFNIRNIYNVK